MDFKQFMGIFILIAIFSVASFMLGSASQKNIDHEELYKFENIAVNNGCAEYVLTTETTSDMEDGYIKSSRYHFQWKK